MRRARAPLHPTNLKAARCTGAPRDSVSSQPRLAVTVVCRELRGGQAITEIICPRVNLLYPSQTRASKRPAERLAAPHHSVRAPRGKEVDKVAQGVRGVDTLINPSCVLTRGQRHCARAQRFRWQPERKPQINGVDAETRCRALHQEALTHRRTQSFLVGNFTTTRSWQRRFGHGLRWILDIPDSDLCC